MTTTRSFPFSPRSTRGLALGDLISVRREDGRWGCLQVTDLESSGPGSQKSLVVGVLPWAGSEPPTPEAVRGLATVEQGLTRIEIFTEGGAEVVANAAVVPHGLPSNFRDFAVGTTHKVWGWRTAIRRVAELDV